VLGGDGNPVSKSFSNIERELRGCFRSAAHIFPISNAPPDASTRVAEELPNTEAEVGSRAEHYQLDVIDSTMLRTNLY